jgi:hypothetical protein
MSTTVPDTLRAIALADIKLSTTGSQAERRKHFDQAAIVAKRYTSDYRKAAAGYIAKLSGAELSKFLLDCIFVSDLQVSTWSNAKPEVLFAGAKRFKVNVEQLRRTLNAAQIPKAKKATRKK